MLAFNEYFWNGWNLPTGGGAGSHQWLQQPTQFRQLHGSQFSAFVIAAFLIGLIEKLQG